MQLPRGTFRSIQKGVNFSDVLAEMVSSRFTGTCTLSSAILNGTLVFRSGVCVLAKVQDRYGDKGWAEVLAVPDLVTDLALSDFNTAQIQLALDFNKKARVTLPTVSVPLKADHPAPSVKSPIPEPVRSLQQARREQKKRETPVVTAAPVEMAEEPSAPVVPRGVREDRSAISPEPGRREDRSEAETAREVMKEDLSKSPEKISGPADASDLDMFDSMDLDDVALKIRKDCKIILKQLQLDHLTEK